MSLERYDNLKVGQRIYYTGDMANFPTYGTITKIILPDRWGGVSYLIKFDDETYEGDTKKEAYINYLSFQPGPGRRFMLEEEQKAKYKTLTKG